MGPFQATCLTVFNSFQMNGNTVNNPMTCKIQKSCYLPGLIVMSGVKEQAVEWILSILSNVGVPSVLPWSFRKIRLMFSGEPERYLQFLKRQHQRDDWLPRFFAGHELHTVYRQDPSSVTSMLKTLSADNKEIIREGAARSWSQLLARDFDTIFEMVQSMADSSEFEHRYTAALAPVRYYDDHATASEKKRIQSFWDGFENDERQGLANLVRSQIQEKRTTE